MTPQQDKQDVLGQLTAEDVSIWLDDISRERLSSGNLAKLVRDFHVRGVTSNPTIFANAMEHGTAYDEQLGDLALRGVDVGEASRSLTTYDIRWACDVLRPVFDASDGVDGKVSIEVDPRLATDTAKTIAEARALWLARRPAERVRQDPGDQGGRARDRRVPGRGHQHQRHADLLAAAVRGGHRRVHGRARGGRRRPRRDADLGGLVLRQPGGHRGRPQARRDRHTWRRRRCAARPRSPTPGSPTRSSSSTSPARAGRRWRPGRQAAAAAVGLDQHQGPVPTGTPCTSRT